MGESPGLRERKKAATRAALHEAALRLAVQQGLENVTVEEIADAANVSRRTFSNYFSSKEEALFHGDADRLQRVLQLLCDAPADASPWTALTSAAERLVAEVDDVDPSWSARRRALRQSPGLVAHQVAAYTTVERELSAEVARRLSGPDVDLRARVLAATFLTALRVALQQWSDSPQGPLRDAVRATLAHAAPAAATTGAAGPAEG